MNRPCVFFDVDGTHFRWQLYDRYIRALVKAGLVKKVVRHKTNRVLKKFKKTEASFGEFMTELLRASEGCMKGIAVEDAEFYARRLVRKEGREMNILPKELMIVARDLGYATAIVTGSQLPVAQAYAEYHEFDFVLATGYEIADDVYTGKLGAVWFHKKDIAVQKLAEAYDLDLLESVAIGDSEADAGMLSVVGYPIAYNVNWKLKQLAVARGHSWPVILERKKLNHTFMWTEDRRMIETPIEELFPPELGTKLAERLDPICAYIPLENRS